eukprot:366552-Chlamydomonas_euryale.AAC.17
MYVRAEVPSDAAVAASARGIHDALNGPALPCIPVHAHRPAPQGMGSVAVFFPIGLAAEVLSYWFGCGGSFLLVWLRRFFPIGLAGGGVGSGVGAPADGSSFRVQGCRPHQGAPGLSSLLPKQGSPFRVRRLSSTYMTSPSAARSLYFLGECNDTPFDPHSSCACTCPRTRSAGPATAHPPAPTPPLPPEAARPSSTHRACAPAAEPLGRPDLTRAFRGAPSAHGARSGCGMCEKLEAWTCGEGGISFSWHARSTVGQGVGASAFLVVPGAHGACFAKVFGLGSGRAESEARAAAAVPRLNREHVHLHWQRPAGN